MAGITERERCDNFIRVAKEFERCLKMMGYTGDEHTLENKEFKTKFVLNYGETCTPLSMNIQMITGGKEIEIYAAYTPDEREILRRMGEKIHKPPAKGAERLFNEAGEMVMCERCGCIDFVKKGEEYICMNCCQSIN